MITINASVIVSRANKYSDSVSGQFMEQLLVIVLPAKQYIHAMIQTASLALYHWHKSGTICKVVVFSMILKVDYYYLF